jgi:NADH dehydrogenase
MYTIAMIISIIFIGTSLASPSYFFILCFMLIIRASLVRLRFDQLISLGWNHLLPLSFLFILSTFLLTIGPLLILMINVSNMVYVYMYGGWIYKCKHLRYYTLGITRYNAYNGIGLIIILILGRYLYSHIYSYH